jgi:tryptophanyl-tRNA synthetase
MGLNWMKSDSPEAIREKVRMMITDRTRIKRTDPGHPEACDVCKMHRLFVAPETADRFDDDCRGARIGCVDRKRARADVLLEYLGPIHERLRYYGAHQDEVMDVILSGSRKAREEARRVMNEVRTAMRIDWPELV